MKPDVENWSILGTHSTNELTRIRHMIEVGYRKETR